MLLTQEEAEICLGFLPKATRVKILAVNSTVEDKLPIRWGCMPVLSRSRSVLARLQSGTQVPKPEPNTEFQTQILNLKSLNKVILGQARRPRKTESTTCNLTTTQHPGGRVASQKSSRLSTKHEAPSPRPPRKR